MTQWYEWIDPPAPHVRRVHSPLHGRLVSDEELSPPRARRRTLIVGPWAGLSTTLARLLPVSYNVTTCGGCGCPGGRGYNGGACRNTDWGEGIHRCPTCDHRTCGQDCGRPVQYGGDSCAVCRGTLVVDGETLRVATPPPPRIWGSNHPAPFTAPFVYAPTKLYAVGRVADITAEDQAALRRGVWIHIVGGTPYLTTDEAGRLRFNHYHQGCWGDVYFSNVTVEDIVRRCQESLDIINMDSPADRHPRGLYNINDIHHGPYRDQPSWNINAIFADRQLQVLIEAITARHQGVGLTVPDSVWVVGCGGIGWNAATQLSLVGVRSLTLIDPDHIEHSNLTRIPASMGRVTRSKAEMLQAALLGTWRGGVASFVTLASRRSIDEFVVDPADSPEVILDTTDDITAQQYTYDLARRLGSRYVRAGYDGGWHVTVSSRRSPDWVVPGEVDGYPVPAWIGGAQIAASLAVTKICKLPRLEVSFSILELLEGLHVPHMEVSEEEYRGPHYQEFTVLDEPQVWTTAGRD